MATTYDAGTEREALTIELARWLAAGFIKGWRANRINRRIGRLARVIGRSRQTVSDELWSDARNIADEVE